MFVAQQKPSRGGIWHPSVMQFYSGPLMNFLSGVDTRPSDRRRRSRSCHCDKARSQLCQQSAAAAWSGADHRTQSGKCSIACRARVPAPPDLPSLGCKHDPVARHGRSSMTLPKAPVGLWSPAKRDLRFGRFAGDTDDGVRHGRSSWKPFGSRLHPVSEKRDCAHKPKIG
jgi:hypothetical protein